MKINIETKYNIGDTLYFTERFKNIVKLKVERVNVFINEDNTTTVAYGFSDGSTALEKHMYGYFKTPEEAGELIAQKAIGNMQEK